MYQVTGPSGTRHKVNNDMPVGEVVVKMWNGDIKPLLSCGRRLKKIVNFYQADETPGLRRFVCGRCFPEEG